MHTRLAMVTNLDQLPLAELMRVSAAIQKQITRDLAPIWGVEATIDAFASIEDVPLGYWKVLIVDEVPGTATGVHDWQQSEPRAWVEHGPTWSLAASHEVLEMLVDPWGQRLAVGHAPDGDDRVEFLVEVCDPSGDPRHAYTVDGHAVSDFYTPEFFDPVQSSGVRYSYTGAIDGPRRIVAGGYLCWRTADGTWFRHDWFDAARKTTRLGNVPPTAPSIRAFLDRETRAHRHLWRADFDEAARSKQAERWKRIRDAAASRAVAVRSLLHRSDREDDPSRGTS